MAGPAAERLTAIYAAFNARDIDTILSHLAPDVDWPNAWEGGRVHGPEAVREYWTRQWAAIDPSVEPVGFEERPDGTVAVDVRQVVKDLDGAVVTEGRVTHTYAFSSDGLVTRMDVT